MTDELSRLQAMCDRPVLELSPNDVAAIQWAIKKIEHDRRRIMAVLAYVDKEGQDHHHDEFWRGQQSALGNVYALLETAE
jgi:hypothetical protein